jgi:hypothetical protein
MPHPLFALFAKKGGAFDSPGPETITGPTLLANCAKEGGAPVTYTWLLNPIVLGCADRPKDDVIGGSACHRHPSCD